MGASVSREGCQQGGGAKTSRATVPREAQVGGGGLVGG